MSWTHTFFAYARKIKTPAKTNVRVVPNVDFYFKKIKTCMTIVIFTVTQLFVSIPKFLCLLKTLSMPKINDLVVLQSSAHPKEYLKKSIFVAQCLSFYKYMFICAFYSSIYCLILVVGSKLQSRRKTGRCSTYIS